MICLSRTTGYAIQALGCMTAGVRSPYQITDIAKCARVPRPYLAKIIATLARKGLIFTKRGYRGGISLARPGWDISLLDIVEAVEGDHWLPNCLLGFATCAQHSLCVTQTFWKRMCRDIITNLGHINLNELHAVKVMHAQPQTKQQPRRVTKGRATNNAPIAEGQMARSICRS